ncbi:hypothetical protein EV421DRAFT_1742747 [Armillaria borealis]|uniref:Uncharacterized protein n=1 Tax=Armillaria borealis TaxID=47425 RepID=A0AA39IWS6_9AGAR|nr:hypothetical protein EV421DRAFT_1742747 [Armillaria borealis]
MALDRAKSGVSNHPKNFQHSPDFHLPACTPPSPQWPGFYQQPIKCNIIDGTGWIDFLWEVLHHTDPPLYHASGCFDSTSRILGLHLTLHHRCLLSPVQLGYLESVFPGLISDILQEIKDNSLDTVEFSVNLRQRCKTVVLELEYKMSMLQAVVIRQHRDFNPKKITKIITCLYYGGIAIVFLVFALLYPWNPIESTFDSCLVDIGIFCTFMVRIKQFLKAFQASYSSGSHVSEVTTGTSRQTHLGRITIDASPLYNQMPVLLHLDTALIPISTTPGDAFSTAISNDPQSTAQEMEDST